MNVHVSYKLHKSSDIEKEIQQQIEKLGKRLQIFRPELVHLKGTVEQSADQLGISVSLNLRLPSGQLTAHHADAKAVTAIKGAFDDLRHQTTKHKDRLRAAHKWSRWRGTAQPSPENGAGFEHSVAAMPGSGVSADDVRSWVNANLVRLNRFVERELAFRGSQDETVTNLITADEVVDEAVARALGEGEKPEKFGLEPWLYRLAMQAMDEMIEHSSELINPVRLEDSARRQNVTASDEAELQFHQPDETLTREDIIADRRVATPEEAASSDEAMALVESALEGLERGDREAFVLYGMEGFSIADIAAITDRSHAEVQESLARARGRLREAASAAHERSDRWMARAGTL